MEKDFLESLLETPSPSSGERPGIDLWDTYMEGLGLKRDYKDKLGNSCWTLGSGITRVLLSAHIDEICMSVQGISEDGYLSVISLAGMDPRSLPGAQVLVGPSKIPGVFCKCPIHLEKKDAKDWKEKFGKVSIGAETADEVRSLGIDIGSLVVLRRNTNVTFGKNKILGCGLDDKIGVYIVSQIAKKLKEESDIDLRHKYVFYFLAGVQEETGLRGLTVASRNINPDISIDLDVTFATDGDCGVDADKYGKVNLGKGCVIEYGPDKSRRIAGVFKDYAKSQGIPYQAAVSRAGGTNTNTIQLSSSNCETMLVSIPNINMHTANEICDWRDVKSAIDIISGTLIDDLL